MAMIVNRTFSTICRLRWLNYRSLTVAEFSSKNETGDSKESQTEKVDNDSAAVTKDGAAPLSRTASTPGMSGLEKALRMFDKVAADKSNTADEEKQADDFASFRQQFASTEEVKIVRDEQKTAKPTDEGRDIGDEHMAGAQRTTRERKKSESFASLLRRSKLVSIGKPEGRVVVGTIIERLQNDLYIDFGGKFHCACKAPQTAKSQFVRGTKVLIRLHDLEMSSRFLGAERDITLLEADATLIGLLSGTQKN